MNFSIWLASTLRISLSRSSSEMTAPGRPDASTSKPVNATVGVDQLDVEPAGVDGDRDGAAQAGGGRADRDVGVAVEAGGGVAGVQRDVQLVQGRVEREAGVARHQRDVGVVEVEALAHRDLAVQAVLLAVGQALGDDRVVRHHQHVQIGLGDQRLGGVAEHVERLGRELRGDRVLDRGGGRAEGAGQDAAHVVGAAAVGRQRGGRDQVGASVDRDGHAERAVGGQRRVDAVDGHAGGRAAGRALADRADHLHRRQALAHRAAGRGLDGQGRRLGARPDVVGARGQADDRDQERGDGDQAALHGTPVQQEERHSPTCDRPG
ncbi:MAG: hypothetical protein IPH80_16930 [Myxococcales bacterium]|nr:hypothetical protein [Myxococcales bacterium]